MGAGRAGQRHKPLPYKTQPHHQHQQEPYMPAIFHKDKPPQLTEYRLLAGQHSGPDFDEEPTPVRGEPGFFTFPSRTYNAGEVFKSNVDLVDKHGASKFQEVSKPVRGGGLYVDDRHLVTDPSDLNVRGGVKAPHGQVSTGKQISTGGDEQVDNAVKSTHDSKFGTDEESSPHDDPGAAKDFSPPKPQQQQNPQQPEPPAKKAAPANLEVMSLKDMRDHAEANKIDLKGANNRAEVLRVVKAHYA